MKENQVTDLKTRMVELKPLDKRGKKKNGIYIIEFFGISEERHKEISMHIAGIYSDSPDELIEMAHEISENANEFAYICFNIGRSM